MTRVEKLKEQKQRHEERLRQARLQLSATRREITAQEEKARATRRRKVGVLAEEAGLFDWEDTTLSSLFAQLATLKHTPDPVAVLEGLLSEPETILVGGARPQRAWPMTQ